MGEGIHIQLHRKKVGGKNYSRSEVLELLHTLKAILPVGPEGWAQAVQIHNDNFPDTDRSLQNLRRKYNDLYRKKIPTGDPNCPKEVKLAKKPYKMEAGYQNNTEDNKYISSEDDVDDDDSDDDNIPRIVPLGQPSQTTTQPTQQSMEPTQQSTEPTQPTEPTQQPTAALSTFPTNPRTKTQYTNCHKRTTKNCSTLLRQYRRNTTNGRQDNFLIEHTELEREQRREDHRLEREHREDAFQA
eukprot:jgi/Psemu1/21299/gm1.21299_g